MAPKRASRPRICFVYCFDLFNTLCLAIYWLLATCFAACFIISVGGGLLPISYGNGDIRIRGTGHETDMRGMICTEMGDHG